MQQSSVSPALTFEDAMTVHVLRAQGVIFSELTLLFGANPARFHEILHGKLYPGSWEEAVRRLSAGDAWHPEIERLVDRLGHDRVLSALSDANPSKRRFQKELKRLRTSAPIRRRLDRGRRLSPAE